MFISGILCGVIGMLILSTVMLVINRLSQKRLKKENEFGYRRGYRAGYKEIKKYKIVNNKIRA